MDMPSDGSVYDFLIKFCRRSMHWAGKYFKTLAETPRYGNYVPHGRLYRSNVNWPFYLITIFQPIDASSSRAGPDKFKVLRRLHTVQPKFEPNESINETICCCLVTRFFDSFDPQFTSWAIPPKMDSVTDYIEFAPQKLHGRVAKVCWGLSAQRSSRASYIFTASVPLTGTSSPPVLLSTRTFA